jgi:hypothetical protein
LTHFEANEGQLWSELISNQTKVDARDLTKTPIVLSIDVWNLCYVSYLNARRFSKVKAAADQRSMRQVTGAQTTECLQVNFESLDKNNLEENTHLVCCACEQTTRPL